MSSQPRTVRGTQRTCKKHRKAGINPGTEPTAFLPYTTAQAFLNPTHPHFAGGHIYALVSMSEPPQNEDVNSRKHLSGSSYVETPDTQRRTGNAGRAIRS